MVGYEPRMAIRRDDDGIWQIHTGVYQSEPIPHPSWRDAWSHAGFIYRIEHGEA
jgi:hypothetical protein